MARPSATRGESSASQARALKLWVVLSRAHAAVEAHARAHVATHELTLPEFGILEVLYHKGRMLLGEVQRKILVSSGGITYLVDRLEARGLVERLENPADRRARFVSLTRQGEKLIQRIFQEHAQMLERALSGLDAGEQDDAIDLLRQLGTSAASLARGE